MNERIARLANQVGFDVDNTGKFGNYSEMTKVEKFAELIFEECRRVVADLYRNTPLELCGPLLTADEKIAEHFYGVDK